jgi:hypothetical protein
VGVENDKISSCVKRPLNYLEYKKDYDLDAHVQVFKAIIKINNETVDEEIPTCLILC